GANETYIRFAQSGREEPLSIHADHFTTNTAYSVGAYIKGHVFLTQLQYTIGKPAFDRGMLRYYHTWRYKHPNPNDFIRIMEKESGLELDWYKEYMVYTTHTIDYDIERVGATPDGKTAILLKKKGVFPMPIDLEVTLEDGTRHLFNIPLRIMRGAKPAEDPAVPYTILDDWPWTHPEYEAVLNLDPAKIKRVVIDPSGRMADVSVEKNTWEAGE
ncbi:MAG: M1 family peptidase, partial [Bacteroidetes bacterium]